MNDAVSVSIIGRDQRSTTDFEELVRTLYAGAVAAPRSSVLPDDGTLFLARRGETPVARACCVANEAIAIEHGRTILLGWYECADDQAAADALFDAVAAHWRERDYAWLVGPMNGNTWAAYRVAEPGGAPFLLDQYNMPWYAEQFDRAGFRTIARYSSARHPLQAGGGRVERFEKVFGERGIRIRTIRPDRFEDELRAIHQVSAVAFARNFLYSPIDFDRMRELYRGVEALIDPDMVLIAEDDQGVPQGFLFAVPNLLEPGVSIVIKTVAVLPGWRTRGLGTLLSEKVHGIARTKGYAAAIHALMHEGNESMNVLAADGEVIRRYRLFARPI